MLCGGHWGNVSHCYMLYNVALVLTCAKRLLSQQWPRCTVTLFSWALCSTFTWFVADPMLAQQHCAHTAHPARTPRPLLLLLLTVPGVSPRLSQQQTARDAIVSLETAPRRPMQPVCGLGQTIPRDSARPACSIPLVVRRIQHDQAGALTKPGPCRAADP
jgi:hypothetical protein